MRLVVCSNAKHRKVDTMTIALRLSDKTLLARLYGPAIPRAKRAAIVVAASLLIWLSAKIVVPFFPVPMTLQTLAVLSLASALGPRLGISAVALYLVEGVCGLPVFAGSPEKGVGLAYMMGPTGGYLLGMLPAAALAGILARRGWDRHVGLTALSMVAGNLVIYAFGIAWLGTVVGWDKPVLTWGLYPFLLGDLLKIAIAAILLPASWRMLGR